MKLQLLGTGTPTPSLERASSSNLLEIGSDLILFDAGPGSYVRFQQAGRKLTDITHVVFSHFHYDHCADFASFALARWDQSAGQHPELRVYGPNHVHKFIDSLFSKGGAFGPDQMARTKHAASLGYYNARGGSGERRPFAPEVTELKAGDTFLVNGEEENWTLNCVEVPHVQPYLTCLGFRIDSGAKSFCYSGDSSYSKAFINMSKDTDVLVHMCHRISGTELSDAGKTSSPGHMDVARIATEASAKICVLTHVTEQMDIPGVQEFLTREIGEIYDGHLIWGRDLMKVNFDGPRPGQLL